MPPTPLPSHQPSAIKAKDSTSERYQSGVHVTTAMAREKPSCSTPFEWRVPARAALYAPIGERLKLGRKLPTRISAAESLQRTGQLLIPRCCSKAGNVAPARDGFRRCLMRISSGRVCHTLRSELRACDSRFFFRCFKAFAVRCLVKKLCLIGASLPCCKLPHDKQLNSL